ncbi:alkylated DNA repair dioxygenase [Paraburkholderia sp. UCT31]|uniref:alpha-ketoglutarate-dependent dioxygenase AlkB n=1 Tax=Paraburkholderia sp. UCT31 TaxID=2615209 RepID=UPI001655982C|nr:alpha-ketoglutarate-dependent dioxygenase AlkB [Paraburkholderia sp. UCT31]MBC8739728.1 alkylated DNA repair dioxygenase [Paraburkholderia sp. UCT31]
MTTPISYYADFVKHPAAAFRALWDELAWERRGNTPRREYYANDVPTPYVYGRGVGQREYLPQPWHPVMLDIQRDLEELAEVRFEVCFLNGYENQKDQLGWHADDGPTMDPKRPIAIVSLGAERQIWFRPAGSRYEADKMKLMLASGSLCLMHPGMQQTHEHRIPKADYDCGERISLTFRGYSPV